MSDDTDEHEAGPNFWTTWIDAEPAPKALVALFQQAATFLNIKIWEVRMKPDPAPEEEGETDTAYGNNFYIMISPDATKGQTNPGFHLRWIVVHELLHAYFWQLEELIVRAFKKEDPARNMLYRYWHGELDRLALILVPVIFGDYNPQEDVLNEPTE